MTKHRASCCFVTVYGKFLLPPPHLGRNNTTSISSLDLWVQYCQNGKDLNPGQEATRWHWHQITEMALYSVESIPSRHTVYATAVSNLEQDGIKIWKDIHWYCFSRLTNSLRVEKISLCLVCQDLQIPLSGFLLLESRPTRTSCQSNLKKLLRRDQETIAPEELQTSGALALERFILQGRTFFLVFWKMKISHISAFPLLIFSSQSYSSSVVLLLQKKFFPSPNIFLIFFLRFSSLAPNRNIWHFIKDELFTNISLQFQLSDVPSFSI